MTEDPVRDLTLLRHHFSTLQNALATNDVAAVETATAALRASLEHLSTSSDLPPEAKDIVRDIDALSGDVAETLNSRLRAFDFVLEALKNQEGSQS